MRPSYSMQTVTREFFASPVSWGREPVLRSLLGDESRAMSWPRWVEMKCGHCKRDPWQAYDNETAVRVAAGLHALHTEWAALGRVEAPKPRRVRCYECRAAENDKRLRGAP